MVELEWISGGGIFIKSILIIVDTEYKDKELRNEIVKNINNHLGEDFKKHYIYLDKTNIKSCLGCFNCWVKTPGKCIINDDNEEKNRLFVQCDYIICISRISYGMYSSSFKVIFDRIIPNISPFFEIINGEMHHKKRYKKDFKMFIIGYNSKLYDCEKRTFKELFNRNIINFHCRHNEFLIVEDSENLKERIESRLDNFCEVG